MSAAPQPDPLDRRLAPARDRVDVIKFEPYARSAEMPALADEAALPAVPLPHRALHGHRDVPRVFRGASRPRSRCRPELLLLEEGDAQLEEALEHRRHLAAGDLMAHERPGVL